MLPLLSLAADGQEHSLRDAIETLAEYFGLNSDELRELLPSGQQPIFHNRVGWARTYLKKAGLLHYPRRAYFQITDRGQAVLAETPATINNEYLKQFPEFRDFQSRSTATQLPAKPADDKETPEEAIEQAYQTLRDDLASELLQTIMGCSPAFFEKLVVDLLVRMGYGGTRRDAGQAIGGSGDGGIDGIIKEDRLGLDILYVQAKRWEGVVGRPEIQKFAGALQGQRARKGIFITTSSFSREATSYVSYIDSKIILIDGEQLAQLMIDYNVGVAGMAVYELKRMDSDYFLEE